MFSALGLVLVAAALGHIVKINERRWFEREPKDEM